MCNMNPPEKWLNEPICDAHGVVLWSNTDGPYTKRDYIIDFYGTIVNILTSHKYNIISENKLKHDLAQFIYKYSE